ncbi:Uncharacterized conserved protein PhnB, glyoxalase superfamily [Devosia sp. YR412]|uniref:VOC family protein n=1 Tax=Devosia sp. YR412 TaxID=1881030 RepID=UPI0008CD94E1|nr:VOC family protein [Devosia sp. YR412]SEP60485.1 Uncharacterized conserved protein PhnB, glyoxalase superfamily [Devosia sp. YR412]
MRITSLYPLFQVKDVEASARFYETHFGFTRIFSSDWYVQLRATADHPFEIALIGQDHDSIPVSAQGASKSVILSLYVEDAAAELERLIAAGLTITQPLRDEVFGQRHFILADPDGILIDVITPIEPA